MTRVLATLGRAIERWIGNQIRTYNATKGKP